MHVQFGIRAVDLRMFAPVPIASLHTAEHGQTQSFDCVYVQSSSSDGVVYSERAVFESAEYKSVAELFVKISRRKLESFVFSFYIEV